MRLWGVVRGYAQLRAVSHRWRHTPGSGYPGGPHDRRLPFLAAAGALVGVGLIVAWMGQRANAAARAKPGITWSVSAASNKVTIRLTPGSGPSAGPVAASSRIVVSESGRKHKWRAAPGRGMVRVPVPPGGRTQVFLQVQGPEPITKTLTVTLPPRLVTTVHHTAHGLLIRASSPLRRQPLEPLCGTDQIGFPAPTEVTVTKSPEACRAGAVGCRVRTSK